jgi:hypothetical protein
VVKVAISVEVRAGLHSKVTTGLETQIVILAGASLVVIPMGVGTGAFPALTLVLVAAALPRLPAVWRIARNLVASVSLVPTLVLVPAPSAALVREE